MHDFRFGKAKYGLGLFVILGFSRSALKIVANSIDQLTAHEYLLIRLVSIAIVVVALFFLVRRRLRAMNLSLLPSYILLLAFFFSPQAILFAKSQIDVSSGAERFHFWFGVPVGFLSLLVTFIPLLTDRIGHAQNEKSEQNGLPH